MKVTHSGPNDGSLESLSGLFYLLSTLKMANVNQSAVHTVIK